MRLLNVHAFRLHTFYGDKIPPYAILSHTWLEDHEEVTFVHFQAHPLWGWRQLPGARKIDYLCQQAADDGYDWAWIDTCCIDKTNNSELSEAINSMFSWYEKAEVCYVYLSDIKMGQGPSFLESRWWSRAWTLQELVAPKIVRFYDGLWECIGLKTNMADQIAHCSGIDIDVLHHPFTVSFRSIAERMSWAARRHATRSEDLAYSLLGIFGINMTMLYGEGEEAFVRLQKEIMRTTNDLSLLAWKFTPQALDDIIHQPEEPIGVGTADFIECLGDSFIQYSEHGLFAARPSCFAQSRDIVFFGEHAGDFGIEERQGMVLTAPMLAKYDVGSSPEYQIVCLPCSIRADPCSNLCILLRKGHHDPLKPFQYRTMRDAFAEDIYTCLIRSEHLFSPNMLLGTVRVDTSTSLSQIYQFRPQANINRTLIIDFTPELLHHGPTNRIEVIPPRGWVRSANNATVFRPSETTSTRGDLVVRLQGSKRSDTPILFIGIRLSFHDGVPDRVALVWGPPGRKNPEQEPSHIARELSDADKRYDNVNRSTPAVYCNHKRLYAEVKTGYLFNQAVTRLVIQPYTGARTDVGDTLVTMQAQTTCVTWWPFGGAYRSDDRGIGGYGCQGMWY